MIILLLDIGNTSVKIGIADQQTILTSYVMPTDIRQGSDCLGLQMTSFLQHAELAEKKVRAVLVSSVVPAMNPIVKQACRRYFQVEARFAHLDLSVPLINGYAHPAEVGADRLVAAYAARHLFPDSRSVISVDYGTATTFDCVTDDRYLGGLICPGIMSSLSALSVRTAQLPKIALIPNNHTPIVGRDTVTSLNHGFLFGFASMTEGLLARLKDSLEGDVATVITGGFAQELSGVLHCVDAVHADLILEGLHLLWRHGITN
ncbi:MAG: type III pantothenate kinase [Desulfovibrionaceae bacterium]|nr:type III pantothenate kinase [Desulfovibrionaceae bacterium]